MMIAAHSQPVAAPARVAVVIPTHNAESHIVSVIRGLPAFVDHIIVIDDASPDRSGDLARAAGDPRVEVIRHDTNQGVGGATLTGYARALELDATIMVKMDADGQMDPAHLLRLLRPLVAGEADYTKGNRFLHTRELVAMPAVRRIGNIGLSFLVKTASGYWNIFDPSNGYTALSARAYRLLDQRAIARRAFFETSLLIELALIRAVVSDVYIPARYGLEKSSLSEWQTLRSFPPRLLRGLIRRIWIQHFLRDFGLFAVFVLTGLALTTFGVIFGLWQWIESVQQGVGRPTGTIMLAVLTFVFGMQCLLQALIQDVQGQPIRPVSADEAAVAPVVDMGVRTIARSPGGQEDVRLGVERKR